MSKKEHYEVGFRYNKSGLYDSEIVVVELKDNDKEKCNHDKALDLFLKENKLKDISILIVNYW